MIDFKEIIDEINIDYPEFDYILETYHPNKKKITDKSIDVRDIPDPESMIGVAICYPNSQEATHINCFEESSKIRANKFKEILIETCENLRSKI